eukprot:GHVS01063063.1.p1 GENE.GHVS01063063.1~~GHVS01063063.1.p1  ORF type:complete len:547 (+),score=65.96 GHVS01063063.1:140-1780(+)
MFAHYHSRSLDHRPSLLEWLRASWQKYRRVAILLSCCLGASTLWWIGNRPEVRGPPSYRRFFDGQTEILSTEPACFQDMVLRMSVLQDAVDENKSLSPSIASETAGGRPLLVHCHSHSLPHPDNVARACEEQWSEGTMSDPVVGTCTFLFDGATYTVRNSWAEEQLLPTQPQLLGLLNERGNDGKTTEDQGHRVVHFVWTAAYKLTGMMLVAIDSVAKNMPAAVVKLHAVLPDMGKERVIAEHRSQLLPFWFAGVDLQYITYMDINQLFKGTPLEEVAPLISDYLTNYLANYAQGVVASDIMRLAVLYRDGGIYLDSDMVMLTDVTRLGNSLGCESSKATTSSNGRIVVSVPKCVVCNAMMSFFRQHPFLHAAMHALRAKSKSYSNLRELSKTHWGFVGTKLMQDQLEDWYKHHPGSVIGAGHFNATAPPSGGIHLYGREVFFPLSWDTSDGDNYVGHPNYWFDARFGNVRAVYERWTSNAPVALHLYHAALRRAIGATRFADLLARQPNSFVGREITRNCRVFCDFTYLRAYSPDEMIKRKRIAV